MSPAAADDRPTRPRIGVKLPSSGPGAGAVPIGEAAAAAEQAGFDSVWVSDHVVMPRRFTSRYPYSPDGSVAWNAQEPWYEALVAMAVAAAVTRGVEVGVGVLVVPMRNPVLLAKQVATLDDLSGGRIVLGVGAGWLAEEFEALDAPFEGRGERLDEWMDIMRELWSGASGETGFRHYRLPSGLLSRPTPARTVPLIVGGMSTAALRRAGRRGDGWFALQAARAVDTAVLRSGIEVMALEAAAARRPVPRRVVMRIPGPAAEVARHLPSLGEVGVTDLVVDVDWDDPGRTLETVRAASA